MLTFHFDVWTLLQFFLGPVLPLIVGLITTRMTAGNKKSLLLLALSVVSSALTELLSWYLGGREGVFDVFQWLVMAVMSFVVGVGLHFGLYKTPGSDGVSIADKLANRGIKADDPDYATKFVREFGSLEGVTATFAPNVGLSESKLHLEAPEGDLAAFVTAPGPKHLA
ncbi:holin [Arthrobacter phage Chridison]|uniref:Holin n=4 Tax=Korravirus hunterdalle TaxID=1982080 RepID=A0A3G8FV61_9CAUD|nr:holin [Arthrobacter phage Aledel]AZS07708.1 holin [Arthrobacter phage Eunoia]AZS09170.1 holin [Arthrobacter phage OMalley]AZS09654.1 holin [Arthrobacter phage Riovina]AZS10400.1 holin [Arthrobacter phage Supakev]WAB09075.1 holin [Arthrobacter phage Chridison]